MFVTSIDTVPFDGSVIQYATFDAERIGHATTDASSHAPGEQHG